MSGVQQQSRVSNKLGSKTRLSQDIANLEWAKEVAKRTGTNVPDVVARQGGSIQDYVELATDAREKALKDAIKSGVKINANYGDLVEETANEVATNTFKSTGQTVDPLAVRSEIRKILDPMLKSKYGSKLDYDNLVLNIQDLHDLTQGGLYKEGLKGIYANTKTAAMKALTDPQKVALKSLDRIISNNYLYNASPEYQAANDLFSTLYNQAGDLTAFQRVGRGTVTQSPKTSIMGKINEGVLRGVYGLQEKAAGLGRAGFGKPIGTTPFTRAIGTAGIRGAGVLPMLQTDTTRLSGGVEQPKDITSQVSQGLIQPRRMTLMDGIEAARQMGIRKNTELMTWGKAIMEDYNAQLGGTKQTDYQRKLSGAAEAATQALNTLVSTDAEAGGFLGLGGRAQDVIGTLGLQTKANTDYRSQLALARTLLKNALLGSQMSEAEIASIEAFIPNYYDSKEQAVNKLNQFINLLGKLSQNVQ